MKKVMMALLILTVVIIDGHAQEISENFFDLQSLAAHDSDVIRFNNQVWSPDGKFIALSDGNSDYNAFGGAGR